ncbi:MAG: hypothetical protein Q4F84_07940, partial [Fibrobacter sp.]|nr:hypothetical protein [Fibrobacter sp.]
QITVNLDGLTTVTYPFEILPGAIDSLALEYQNGNPVPDTITLSYPSGQMRIYSVGYDKYGNKRGPEPSDWGTDSTLHPIAWPDSIDNIFYDASTVKENEAGNVTASLPWHTSKELKASTFVRIYGPLTTISNAVTRDSNGNGYLDHIEIHFSKAVTLPDSVLESMKIVYGAVNFEIEGVVGDPARADSVWVIAIKEEKNGKPQTAWTPSISFNRSLEAEIEEAKERSTSDGAGPVIWKVTKEIKVTGDRTKDVITVEFSESVRNAHTGATLGSGDVPNMMFYVWIEDPVNPGNYIKVDSMLVGIENLQSGGDNVAVFTTSNNKDITARHFFTIQTVSTDLVPSYLSDRTRTGDVNFPDSLNQKVRVVVTGPQPTTIDLGPNPTIPTERRVPAGQFLAVHEPNARRWVREDHAGTVITFPLVISTLNLDSLSDAVKLRCNVKVYDLVGNMVNSAKNEDILESIRRNVVPALQRRAQTSSEDASVYPLDIYWNGFSKKKVRVAPGVYKIVVALEYHGSSTAKKLNKDVKVPMVGNLGIRMGK